jgi:hypothetical protein
MIREDIKDILPGEGLGKIRFGMSREEVKSIIGEPDEVDNYSYSEEEESLTEAWHYDVLNLSLSFDEEYDWELMTISVSGAEYEFIGKRLIGLQEYKLTETLKSMGIENLSSEDWSTEEDPEHHLLAAEEAGINFWLEKGVLTEIQWSPLFMEEEDAEC